MEASTTAAHAAATGVASTLGNIAGDITSTVGQVAPIAVGVVGVFLVWKYGVKFFKGLSK